MHKVFHIIGVALAIMVIDWMLTCRFCEADSRASTA